jgi:putative transcriptional regulator
VVVNHLVSATITLQAQSDEPDTPVVDKVYLGGPVSPQVCMVVHGDGWRCEKSQEISAGLLVSEPSSAVPFLIKQEEVPYRFIMGYAGWGPGQLSSEMAQGAWLCAPVSADLVLRVEPKEQWQAVIRHLGIDPMMLVPASSTQ